MRIRINSIQLSVDGGDEKNQTVVRRVKSAMKGIAKKSSYTTKGVLGEHGIIIDVVIHEDIQNLDQVKKALDQLLHLVNSVSDDLLVADNDREPSGGDNGQLSMF